MTSAEAKLLRSFWHTFLQGNSCYNISKFKVWDELIQPLDDKFKTILVQFWQKIVSFTNNTLKNVLRTNALLQKYSEIFTAHFVKKVSSISGNCAHGFQLKTLNDINRKNLWQRSTGSEVRHTSCHEQNVLYLKTYKNTSSWSRLWTA